MQTSGSASSCLPAASGARLIRARARSMEPSCGWMDAAESATTSPKIIALGDFNTMDWAGPEVANQHSCTGGDAVKPPHLELKGYASAACQVVLPEGWIIVTLDVMAGVRPLPHLEPEDAYPDRLYTIRLDTTKDRLKEDLDRLRAVIRSFRTFPPQ